MARNKNTTPEKPNEPDAFPLPKGFDDPSGPYFVPDRYRDAWGRHAGAAEIPKDIARYCRPIAEYRALQESRPELFEEQRSQTTRFTINQKTGDIEGGSRNVIPANPPHLLLEVVPMAEKGSHFLFGGSQGLISETERIMRAEWDTIVTEAEHAIRLHRVVMEHEREEFLNAEAHKLEERNRCPVCGVSSMETGTPDARDIVPGGKTGYGRRITIRSCAGCYLAAVEFLTEQLAHTPVGQYPPKTRLQHVGEYFEKEGF